MEPLLLRLKALRDAAQDMYVMLGFPQELTVPDVIDMLDTLIEEEEDNEVSNNV